MSSAGNVLQVIGATAGLASVALALKPQLINQHGSGNSDPNGILDFKECNSCNKRSFRTWTIRGNNR